MSYLKSIFCWFFPKYRRLTGVFVEISSLPACRRKYFILKLKQRGLLDFKITGSSNSRTEKAIQTALTSKSPTSFSQIVGGNLAGFCLEITGSKCRVFTKKKKKYLGAQHLWKEEKRTGKRRVSFNHNSIGSSRLKNGLSGLSCIGSKWQPFIPPPQSEDEGLLEKNITRDKAASAAEAALKRLSTENYHPSELP